jgi:Domain of unknown function (DUF1876)
VVVKVFVMLPILCCSPIDIGTRGAVVASPLAIDQVPSGVATSSSTPRAPPSARNRSKYTSTAALFRDGWAAADAQPIPRARTELTAKARSNLRCIGTSLPTAAPRGAILQMEGEAALYDTVLDYNWQVDMEFSEDDAHTHASVRARLRDGETVTTTGDAYRNPRDPGEPMIGEEIAAARRLIALGTELLQAASSRIGQVTHLYH